MVFSNNLLFAAAAASADSGFNTTLIGNSIWLDGSADYLSKTPSSAGDRTRWTLAWWFQLNAISTEMVFFSANSSTNEFRIALESAGQMMVQDDNASMNMQTTMLFRDAGWYHCIVSYDSNQTVAEDRVRIYINGIQQTLATGSAAEPSSAGETFWNDDIANEIGRRSRTTSVYANAYMTQICFLNADSIQNGDIAVTDFLDSFTMGTNGSQFVPKADTDIAALATTAGGNSFCLDFANSSDLGNDISGNNNDYTANSMAAANQTGNTPSNIYPVWNTLTQVGSASTTLSEGNTKVVVPDNGGIAMTQTLPLYGLWYWEVNTADQSSPGLGLGQQSAIGYNSTGVWNNTTADTHLYLSYNGSINNNGTVTSSYSSAQSGAVRYAVAWDGDNRAIYFGSISGSTITWFNSGDPASGASKTGAMTTTGLPTSGPDPVYFITVDVGGSSTQTLIMESGDWTGSTNRPSNAKELNTANLTAPTYQGIDYFDATLYEGNGHNQRVGDFVPFSDTFAIGNSAMFNNADIRRLAHTYSSESAATSNSTDQATLSFWIKYLDFADSIGNHQTIISQSNSGQSERFMFVIDNPISSNAAFITIDTATEANRTFTFDKNLFSTQEWSHFLLHLDTNNATAADRMKVWINGNAITSTTDFTGMTQGLQLNLFRDEELYVGHLSPGDTYNANYAFSSYLAEFHLVDGTCQALSNFGQADTSTNRWVPKDYKTNVGTYGNRGFYLKFDGTPGASSGSNMGKDSSGNNIHLTEENGSGGAAWAAGDKTTETPSKNFAILDITRNQTNNLTEGYLKIGPGDANWDSTQATLGGLTSGKWYLEFTPETANSNIQLTLSGTTVDSSASTLPRGATDYGYYFVDGKIYNNDTNLGTYGAAVGAGVVVSMAIDLDEGKLYFGRGGTFENSGNPATGANPGARILKGIEYNIVVSMTSSVTTDDNTINFGSGTSGFAHTPPTGFKAINQDNLDDTASKITAWAWIKNRDTTDNHMLFDRVRGVGNDIHTNSTAIQVSNAHTVQKFLQRGVQIGYDNEVNTLNESYVLWQWLLGDSATTGSTNDSGSIDSTVVVADAGHFSVVQYTGNTSSAQTVGHGLGGVPEAIIVKNLGATSTNWPMLHKDLGSLAGGGNNYILLNDTGVTGANTNYWNDTSPTSTLFSIGGGGTPDTNDGGGEKFIAYCLRSVAGVCKVGSFEGNSIDNGPYISCSFKPRWILVKCATVSDASHDWFIFDSARYTFNGTTTAGGSNGGTLEANDTTAEEAHNTNFTDNPAFDILADGFKLRTNSGTINNTGRTYIYIAMAEIGGGGTLPPIYGR